MMPDLLKNNLLEESALSLVKSMTDIEDIRKRLEGAYGDPKLQLKKKLLQVGNIGQLWKIRDQEKLVDALSKIVNMMRDLHQLAEQHNIKSRLYSGDRLERIHQMMGDSRVTRWLSIICEIEYNDQQTWHHLKAFLEHDLKVQQQKLLILNKPENKRQKQAYEEKGHVGKYNSRFTSNSSMEPKCCSCEKAKEHVLKNEPKGPKFVQYLACQKFVEWLPNTDFKN